MLYVSTAVVDLNERELETLLGPSRLKNEAADVTGLLLHLHDARGAYFVQHLEGPQRAVQQAFERISRDELHVQATVLHCGQAERRAFAAWPMRLLMLEAEPALDLAKTVAGPNRTNLVDLLADRSGVQSLITSCAAVAH
nr:BLUF domain-containing protein [Kineosporia babensis]